MASKFQNRLVGTIILVSIGVIVLPDVLDGQKTHYKEDIASIPIKPELDSDVETFEVLAPEDDSASLPPSPVEVVVDAATAPTNEDKVEVVEKPVPERNQYQESAWIIQLMALKNADNAANVVKDLQKRVIKRIPNSKMDLLESLLVRMCPKRNLSVKLANWKKLLVQKVDCLNLNH
ncbi:cell division protein DedD [Vibrio taketomensis]|uniref:cell division protein DedD n=1 Tax=Vibrio taketomensis TaxID=2572923 RepID=UPI0039E9E579